MIQEKATVLRHDNFQGDYRILHLDSPGIGPHVKPGQFIHLQVPQLGDRILRRPFSIYKADEQTITLLYKPVGRGTASMGLLKPDHTVDLIGPLGNGYPPASDQTLPVLVAGGYGNAALYLKARSLNRKGVAFFGGRTAEDILCVEEFQDLGWEVRPTTNDGSLGTQGLVTDAFDPWMQPVDCSGPMPGLPHWHAVMQQILPTAFLISTSGQLLETSMEWCWRSARNLRITSSSWPFVRTIAARW